MTVKELIKALKKCDPEKMVVSSELHGGFSKLKNVEKIQLNLDVNPEKYYGPHQEDKNGECHAIYIY